MPPVDRLQYAWDSIRRRLYPDCGSQMRRQVNVTVIAEGIGLDLADRPFDEARRQRIFAEDEFIGALGAFEARPGVVPPEESDSGFKQITIENCAVGERAGTAPEERAGPIGVVEGRLYMTEAVMRS